MLNGFKMGKEFHERTGLTVQERHLVEMVEADAKGVYERWGGKDLSYSAAQQQALERIINWVNTCDEYMIEPTYADMFSFVSGSRQACVWAVLFGKAHKVMAEIEPCS